MALAGQRAGGTGLYWGALEAGIAEPGVRIELRTRPRPDWSLARLIHLLSVDTRNRSELQIASALPELAESWRLLLCRRLRTGAVEDWSKRVTGGERGLEA